MTLRLVICIVSNLYLIKPNLVFSTKNLKMIYNMPLKYTDKLFILTIDGYIGKKNGLVERWKDR